jgi:DNA-binding Lrp family transcriptional regulator
MQATTTTVRPESVKVLPSYIVASVEPRALNSVVEQIRKEKDIVLVAPTSGRLNLVVQFNSNETAKVYPLVNKLRSMKGVRSTNTLIPFEGHLTERKPMSNEAFAFVLLGVQEQAGKVLEQLKETPIHSAYVVPGEFDIIATLSGKDHNEVLERVAKMTEIPGVERSETMFAYKPIWA